MHILVTGGTGFLGSHLCHQLIASGAHVICVDNNYTGSMRNIAALMTHERFTFIHHDITAPLVIHARLDQIYNLACPASPAAYQGKAAIMTTKTCVLGALNMLELARQHGAVILQASTSEIYGEPQVHPQTESYCGNVNPVGIRACYDEGKRCAESLFFDYYREMQVSIKVARIFNTYGPHMAMNDGRVVSNFICQALQHRPVTIYGDGSQTRSFCYVNDLTEGLIRLMNSPDDVTGPVNLGNPGEFTVRQLAEQVMAKVNSHAGIIYQPLPQDDPTQRRPDITLAQQKLSWTPAVSLDEGLDKTIAYFSHELGLIK